MKRLILLLFTTLTGLQVSGQVLQFSPGEKYVCEDGTISYSSEVSLIRVLNPMVYMNLVSREKEGAKELFIVLSLPTKNLDKVSEDSALSLTLSNGSTLELQVNEKVVWDASTAPAKKASEISLINIPYRVTRNQIEELISSSVKKISIPGSEKTVSFSVNGASMSKVLNRQLQELNTLADKETSSTVLNGRSLAQGNNEESREIANSDYIHETPNTKSFIVSNLEQLSFGPYSEGYIIVTEKNTLDVHVFDSTGRNTGNYRTRYSDGRTRKVSDGVIVDLPESDTFYYAAIDVTGKELFRENRSITDFIDGITLRTQTVADRVAKYLDKRGQIVFPASNSNIYLSWMQDQGNLFPLSCGRRKVLVQNWSPYDDVDATPSYGYLNENYKLVIPAQYAEAMDYSEGLAAVCNYRGDQPYWGFIDTDGKMVIQMMFSNKPGNFFNGVARVTKNNGKVVYINKEGKVISPEYYGATDFSHGYALVVTENNGRISRQIIDTSFETVRIIDDDINPYFYTDAKSFPQKMPLSYAVDLNTKYKGYSNDFHSEYNNFITGELLFMTDRYTEIGPIDAITWYSNSKTREKGLINTKGEIILKFVESEF